MNQIELYNETKQNMEYEKELMDFLQYALQEEKVENAYLSLIVVNDEEIRNINREYRGKDAVTDVISFALEEGTSFPTTQMRVLGDIYLSIDKCRSQAEEYGHSFKRELFFLSLHGLLHLLGYDHMNEEEEKAMFGRQELILDAYGIKREA